MKKLKSFHWGKKDKYNQSSDKSKSDPKQKESCQDSTYPDELPEDLLVYTRRRKETDEDAFSVHSVDCRQRKLHRQTSAIKDAILNKFGLSSSKTSLSSVGLPISPRPQSVVSTSNLNSISERGEISCRHLSNLQLSKNQYSSARLTRPNFKGTEIITNQSCNSITALDDQKTFELRRAESLFGVICPFSDLDSRSEKFKSALFSKDRLNEENLFTKKQLQRSNIIFELYCGEVEIVKDIYNVLKNYKEPMETLGLISEGESFIIFYKIDKLIPLHEDLINQLEVNCDSEDGVLPIGKCFLKWVENLNDLCRYCVHLRYAKHLLEEKRENKQIDDFLTRCRTSPFSRRLDLWDFLDKPRSRFMKYPILLDRIIKCSSEVDGDIPLLQLAVKRLERVIARVNERTGEEMCNFYLEKIDFSEDNAYLKLVKSQKVLMLESKLRTSRGTKVNAFLFHDVMVLTIPHMTETGIRYKVLKSPLPTHLLILEDIPDGVIKIGSFRSTFCTERASRNIFCLCLKYDPDNPSNFSQGLPISPKPLSSLHRYLSLTSRTHVVDSTKDNFLNYSFHQADDSDRIIFKSIFQTSNYEEKRMWLTNLRKVVFREVKKEPVINEHKLQENNNSLCGSPLPWTNRLSPNFSRHSVIACEGEFERHNSPGRSHSSCSSSSSSSAGSDATLNCSQEFEIL